jgi:5-hydroxyisourate hydrolase
VGPISTHVLDSALGQPAAGVPVRLFRLEASAAVLVATGVTDGDGRIGQVGEAGLPAGVYRLVFDTGSYFAAGGREAFYPEVAVSFLASQDGGRYHVPLLLSPFGYTTYRGS